MPEKTIEITAPDFRSLLITVRGRPPGLLCDNYPERVKEDLKWREANPNKKVPKQARDPEREYRESLYVVAEENGQPAVYGFPAMAFKKAMIAAADRFVGLDRMGPTLGGAIQIESPDGELLPLLRTSKPLRREDSRGIQGKRSSLVYRAWFTEWEADIPLSYDADILGEEQVINLLARAGEQVGIGNWRSEKKGIFGRFEVVGGKF
jgi:hypothetical protein